MSKQIRSRSTPSNNSTELARNVWLAGLGAVSVAQQKGRATFGSLVSEGRSFQSRSEKVARTVAKDVNKGLKDILVPVRARVEKGIEQAGNTVENVVGGVLNRFGVPSRAEIRELTTRVTELNRQIKSLSK
ncbi:MAG TPA: phasin family protein [Xanthomonadaceae bacterium]|nr:phasin family protein [Xanthomonadaceae bacterium]